MTDTSNVKFFVDGVKANNGKQINISNMAATDLLEPYLLFARTSNGGTERAHSMDIDYVKCTWKRS
jgi:protein involved in ribonucleotide reduction